jgi:hypothetical protein
MKQRMKIPYEKRVAIRSASSLARGIARYSAKRRHRIGGVGIQLRKLSIRTPTPLYCAEGNMNKRDSASSCSVRRSRRPQTRLETSCTRTGRPRRHLWLNQAGDRRAKAKPQGPHVRPRGVTQRHTTYEPFEQRRNVAGGEWGGKAVDQGEHWST